MSLAIWSFLCAQKSDLIRGSIQMKYPSHTKRLLRQIPTLPLAALRLSAGKRLLIVVLSYGLGVAGLWYFFPLVHNGATMYLPIISASFLFRYPGMFISLVLNGIIFQLTYTLLLRGMLPDQAFIEGGIIGFGTSLLLSLVVCWLRTAVDLIDTARAQAFAAEQERLQATLAYESQRKLNELKDHFLLNVSHELRTPLTVLAGSMDLLFEHDERLEGPAREGLLTLAKASHEELVHLVNQVLDATHVMSEISSVQSEVVSLHQLVQEELAALSQEDPLPYTIHVEVSSEVAVRADPKWLRQVLQHLLSNVFKYVPTQTDVTIAATQADPSSMVRFWVQDTGPGIPAGERVLLFEKFVRLKRDLAGTTRGTGLGLYISKRLVEAMGGRIWVESSGQPGEGSRFCMTLPAASPS
jgi:signal transduction histidine kinase